MSGAFTSGVKKPTAATTTMRGVPRQREAEQEERQRHRDDRDRGQLQQVDIAHQPLCGHAHRTSAPPPNAANR